jgi:hypothetical protein
MLIRVLTFHLHRLLRLSEPLNVQQRPVGKPTALRSYLTRVHKDQIRSARSVIKLELRRQLAYRETGRQLSAA